MTDAPVITYTEILEALWHEAERLDISAAEFKDPGTAHKADIMRAAHRIVADHRDHRGRG